MMWSDCFLICIFSVSLSCGSVLNNRPIIGILAQTTDPPLTKYGDTYVRGLYVKFLEQAGSRVVPIRVDEPAEYYYKIFSQINGVLFPGGDKNFTTSYLARAGRVLYDLALKANDAGDYFPLWGTCQGFQLLTNLTAGQNLLVATDTENMSLPLHLTPDSTESRLFGSASKKIISVLTTENITPNFHHFSVLEKAFQATPSLTAFYRALSTNKDRAGKVFISTIEGFKYPFYGTQWHAEKLNFEWTPDVALDHDSNAVLVSQYLSNFFVNEGIIDQSTGPNNTHGDTYIPAAYVKFLEEAGARVVPVRVKQSPEYYGKILSKINGLLFPGGSQDIVSSYLANAARIIYDLVVKANDAGDYFPLWGTCQGFQLLTNLTAGQNLLVATDSENISMSLQLKPEYKSSRLLGKADPEIIRILTNEKVTPNFHHSSVLEKSFRDVPSLHNFYRVISTNQGRQGKVFVSTMEAFKYPFYATQWHPEAISYVWEPGIDIDHSAHAIEITQYLANFFVDEARKSQHRFSDVTAESAAVMENYQPTYLTDGSFMLVYYFNFTKTP